MFLVLFMLELIFIPFMMPEGSPTGRGRGRGGRGRGRGRGRSRAPYGMILDKFYIPFIYFSVFLHFDFTFELIVGKDCPLQDWLCYFASPIG